MLTPTREIALQAAEAVGLAAGALPPPGLACGTFIGGLPVEEDEKQLRRYVGGTGELDEAGPAGVGGDLAGGCRTPGSLPCIFSAPDRRGWSAAAAGTPPSRSRRSLTLLLFPHAATPPLSLLLSLPTQPPSPQTASPPPARRPCHVAVGTTGRVLSLIQRGALRTGALRMLVLDEADKLLGGELASC